MRNAAGLPKGTLKFQRAPMGAGGWLRGGIYISNAGDMMTGGDTGGVWVRASGQVAFTDLMTTSALPAGSFGNSITQISDTLYGMQVMAMAPSNGNVVGFAFNCNLYRCLNALSASPTVTKVSGPYSAATFSSNDNPSLMWPKAAFDPQNPDVVVFGTQGSTLLYSTNWTQASPTVSTITDTTPSVYGASAGYHQVACDPASAVVGGIKQIWYIGTKGVGVKRSTAGPSGPYTLVTGSPANVRSIKVDTSGNVYALNTGESVGSNVYKATSSGNFVKLSPANGFTASPPGYEFCDIAIDPQNTNHIVLVNDNWALAASTDGGQTWGGDVWGPTFNGTIAMQPQSIGWMQARDANGKTAGGPQRGWQPSGGNVVFHPTDSTIRCATGSGLFKSVIATDHNAPWWWQEDTLGVEQLVVIDAVTPPGQKPMLVTADFGMMQFNDDTYAGTTSALVAGVGDDNAYSVEWSAADSNFLVASMGFHTNSISCYRTSPTSPWIKFPGTYPRSDISFSSGVWLPETTNKIRGFFASNIRPLITTDRGATFAYEDLNMPGMKVTSRTYFGTGNGQLIIDSKTAWDGTQTYTIVLNAASGAGSVSVAGSTITVTPATTGTTASAIAAQINANGAAFALVSASFGGTGASSPGTGTQALVFTSGWGFAGLGWDENQRTAYLDKVTGNSYAYNCGDDTLGLTASWAGIWKLPAGGTTWSRIGGAPGNLNSGAQTHFREVLGQADHGFFHANGSLYHTTNGWTTSSQVGDGLGNFFSTVSWCHTGKAAPGQTYPAIYVLGTLNGTYSFWACWDGSWTNWVQYGSATPLGLVYPISCFAAHPDTFGRLDIGTGGAGGYIGTYDCPLTAS